MAKFEIVLEHREKIEAESDKQAYSIFENRILCDYESTWHFIKERSNISCLEEQSS